MLVHCHFVTYCHIVYNHNFLRVSPRLEPSLFDDGWSPTACTGAACFTVTPQLSNPLKATQGEEEPPKKSELLASSHLTKGLLGGVAELIKVGEVYLQEEGGEEKQ